MSSTLFTQSISTAFKDFHLSLGQWRLIYLLTVEDFRARYYRTFLGQIWIALGFAVFAVVKILIFSNLSSESSDFFGKYLLLGYLLWVYISSAMIEGPNVFLDAKNWILGVKIPYTLFLFLATLRNLFVLILNASVSILILIYLGGVKVENIGASLIGMLLIIVTGFWAQLFLAVVTIRFRDVTMLVQTVMRLAFFLTPIIWLPSAMGKYAHLVDWNPFTHFLAIVRNPLLGQEVSALNWTVTSSFCGGLCILSLLLFSLERQQISMRL